MEQNRIERAPTLGARLQKCADFVREGKKLADIGTDHGYVPVCLLQSGKIPFAVAVDVHKGPLESAMNNASRCGVADKMHFVCGDGLHGVSSPAWAVNLFCVSSRKRHGCVQWISTLFCSR